MSTLRDSLKDPWWAETYNRYVYHDPSNRYYGRFAWAQSHRPLTIDSNPIYAIDLDRHGHGMEAYNVGAVDMRIKRNGVSDKINICSDNTGAPNYCARKYLGDKVNFAGNAFYDRLN